MNKKHLVGNLVAWLLVLELPGFASLDDSFHRDGRNTVKIRYDYFKSASKTGFETAMQYLHTQASSLGLRNDLDGLKLVDTKKSLLGSHYYFQQHIDGVLIDRAQIVVSVGNDGATVFRVFNNAVPNAFTLAKNLSAKISKEDAYNIAWKNLDVRGPLMEGPKNQLLYHFEKGHLALVYKVFIATSAPFGYWQYLIDASTGKILQKTDIRITENKKGTNLKPGKQGITLDRKAAFAEFAKKQQTNLFYKRDAEVTRANGEALVFDPDPRTALADSSLQDNSPADKFEAAYTNRVLKDLTQSNGVYQLKGPWVQISDFEPPTTVPTTSTSGKWNFKRGNNGFNDVMTYYHLDQNQRYIQSLGFVGSKGIQNKSLFVDSDGVNGDDNSHFVPSSNKIAFGHGCVDDNEDADVILHEYGHSLQDAINHNWDGGDTGAMGEGFGDYWASSYSLTTQNGQNYHPDEVFQWDGQGEGSPCWPGRRLDVLNAQYEPSKTYYAHQTVGSFVSDELWSTPLFQSLKELLALGYPREQVDQIVLESHFGLGANLTMRDMAKSIVHAAQTLFPNERHAEVFQAHFARHNILETPRANLELKSVETKRVGSNGAIDPGETIELYFTLKNSGTINADAVEAIISSPNASITLASTNASFSDVAAGAETQNRTPFLLTLSPSAICGEQITLDLLLRFAGGAIKEQRLSAKLPTGIAQLAGGENTHSPVLAIPDNNPTGITSSIWLSDAATLSANSNVEIDVDIEHSYRGDLKISLLAPSGKQVLLHNGSGGSDRNLVGSYPTTLTPAESLTKLIGETLNGEWKLNVADTASADTGSLKKWGIRTVLGHRCESP